jgi:hypothetical protein
MKITILIGLGILVYGLACGREDRHNEECALFGCTDDYKDRQVKEGPKGERGSPGPAGKDGTSGLSCTIKPVDGGSLIKCDGSEETIYHGVKGEHGDPGLNGTSCWLTEAEGGHLITCPDGSSTLILDGRPGMDAVVERIVPCERQEGVFNEVLLRLSDRTLVALFDDGSERGYFLSEIGPGSYTTSDVKKCQFQVDDLYNVTW